MHDNILNGPTYAGQGTVISMHAALPVSDAKPSRPPHGLSLSVNKSSVHTAHVPGTSLIMQATLATPAQAGPRTHEGRGEQREADGQGGEGAVPRLGHGRGEHHGGEGEGHDGLPPPQLGVRDHDALGVGEAPRALPPRNLRVGQQARLCAC